MNSKLAYEELEAQLSSTIAACATLEQERNQLSERVLMLEQKMPDYYHHVEEHKRFKLCAEAWEQKYLGLLSEVRRLGAG